MSKVTAFAVLTAVLSIPVLAQDSPSPNNARDAIKQLSALELQIEAAVVRGDVAFLDTIYASDFRFTHGTGRVQNKSEWLISVQGTPFIERQQDSLDVEQHGDVALVTGRLNIRRHQGTGEARYAITYVRVYAIRDGHWQMLSHRTIRQWDLPTQ